MKHKILNELESILHVSPKLLHDPEILRQAIRGTFAVDVEDVSYTHIGELVDKIDNLVLDQYFRYNWQTRPDRLKYLGPVLINKINQLKPRKVLDIGCGYHEFKGKIDNLIGIDPYNDCADICVKLLDYHPEEKYDAIIVLGSINFGGIDKIFAELSHTVDLCNPGAVMFFRVNPGLPHDIDEAYWINFYPWDSNFIINCADQLGVDLLDIKTKKTENRTNRLYFEWKKK